MKRMIYVALLRGINIGGRNKINMKELKVSFERFGMLNVITYINSGNIIFEDSVHSETEIVQLLEAVIMEDFSIEIKVLIRSLNQFQQVMNRLPEDWVNDKTMKSDVLFLWDEIDDEMNLDQFIIRPEIDTVFYVPGAILWSVSRENTSKSGLNRIVSKKIYKQITIRNVNTVRKIFSMMKEFEVNT